MSEAFVPVMALLVKSTLIVGVALAIVQAMKLLRVAAAARHLVWLSAFAALALLPFLGLVLPRVTIAVPYSLFGIALHDLSTPGVHLPDRTTIAWIWIVYAAGAIAMLLRPAGGRIALEALWRKAAPLAAPNVESFARMAGVTGAIEVRIANAPIAPLTWGRRVLLPLQARDWPAARLRDVLLHELCHVARRDSFTQLMAALVRAAFWFSPAVWLALRELRFEQEHACDERVVECGAEAVAYAQTLVDVAATSHPGPLEAAVSTAMVQHSSLERRVATILQRRPARPIGGAWMALISASLLLAGLAVATAHPIDPSRRLGPLVPLDTTLAPLNGTQR